MSSRPADKASQREAAARSGDVVCFGFLTYTLLLMVDRLPPRNGGALVLDSVETVGDDAAIVASILTSWGAPARLITSPLGNDYQGQKVREHLASWGIDAGPRTIPEWPTPMEIAILDPGGGRTYFQRRDPAVLAELKAPSPAQLEGAGLLYADWYDGPSVVSALQTAFSQGVPVFLNLESQFDREPWRSGLLRYVRICQVSLDEPGASGRPKDVARSLLEQGVETAVVTLGAGGSLVAQKGEAWRVRPPAIEAVDCYGAGAAFAAGLIYGFREGWPLGETAGFATAYAGIKCGLKGMAGLPVNAVLKEAAKLDVRRVTL